jgi:hypothetical protein
MPANPAIEADTYGGACCLWVGWRDEVSGQVFATLINETPAIELPPDVTSPLALTPASSTRYGNVAATYWRDFDVYVVTYEANPTSGPNQVVARTMRGYGGGLHEPFLQRSLATVDRPDATLVARPRVTFNPFIYVFLLTWFDRAAERVSGQFMGVDAATPIPYGVPFTISARATEAAAPTPLADGADFAAYLHEPASGGSGAASTVGYYILEGGLSGPIVFRQVVASSPVTARGGAAAGYSPARDTALVVWHQFTSPFTNANDIWGAVVPP